MADSNSMMVNNNSIGSMNRSLGLSPSCSGSEPISDRIIVSVDYGTTATSKSRVTRRTKVSGLLMCCFNRDKCHSRSGSNQHLYY